MLSTNKLSALATAGGNVIRSDGSKIGSISQIYVDDDTKTSCIRTTASQAGLLFPARVGPRPIGTPPMTFPHREPLGATPQARLPMTR